MTCRANGGLVADVQILCQCCFAAPQGMDRGWSGQLGLGVEKHDTEFVAPIFGPVLV